jgi:thioredoxin 1
MVLPRTVKSMILNDQNFSTEVENGGLVLVDFFADWCGPCKLMGPIIEELVEEYKDKNVKIGKLNVDEAKVTAEKYGIMSIPTVILFKNGKVVWQASGVQSKESLKEMIMREIE